MDCSPQGSSMHRICQARTWEWVAISSSRGSFQPRDGTCIYCVFFIGRWILYHWTIREAPKTVMYLINNEPHVAVCGRLQDLCTHIIALQDSKGSSYPRNWTGVSYVSCIGRWVSLMAQTVKNPPAMWEIWVQSLARKDHLEKGTATHSSILTWRIPRTVEPGGLKSMGSQRVRYDWVTFTFTFSTTRATKITEDGDCSLEIKRRLLLGRKVITYLDSILKSRDITLPTKVHLVKAMVFPLVVYGCKIWTIKKAECRWVFWKLTDKGISLVVQWLSLHLTIQGLGIWSLVMELKSHLPWGQKKKKQKFPHKTEAILLMNS